MAPASSKSAHFNAGHGGASFVPISDISITISFSIHHNHTRKTIHDKSREVYAICNFLLMIYHDRYTGFANVNVHTRLPLHNTEVMQNAKLTANGTYFTLFRLVASAVFVHY